MSKIETILTNIPLIYDLQKAKFNLKEICSILKERNNLDINYDTLKPVLSSLKNNKIHSDYDSIIPMQVNYSLIHTVEKYAIKFHGVWFCLDTNNYNPEWKITENTISNIADPVGLLYVKRFLKLYHISDTFLINKYLDMLSIPINKEEQTRIDNISSTIKAEYDKILTALKQKNLELILKVHQHGKRI